MPMSTETPKYRFLMIQPFGFPPGTKYRGPSREGPKEARLMNYNNLKRLLADVEWDLHPGPIPTYGDWAVETREEFCLVAAGRLSIVREACESGKYNAIILLGGGEPGFVESREIARRYGIPVTACAWSQMHVASLLGNRFSVIDLAENHRMYYHDLITRHHFADRCASTRLINYPHPRPPYREDDRDLHAERKKWERCEPSEAVDLAVEQAVAAIEEDGAEVITLGCSGTFWLKWAIEPRLREMGWEVPVTEGYSCAITLAKLMVDLGVDASGLMFPDDRPRRLRIRKVF